MWESLVDMIFMEFISRTYQTRAWIAFSPSLCLQWVRTTRKYSRLRLCDCQLLSQLSVWFTDTIIADSQINVV